MSAPLDSGSVAPSDDPPIAEGQGATAAPEREPGTENDEAPRVVSAEAHEAANESTGAAVEELLPLAPIRKMRVIAISSPEAKAPHEGSDSATETELILEDSALEEEEEEGPHSRPPPLPPRSVRPQRPVEGAGASLPPVSAPTIEATEMRLDDLSELELTPSPPVPSAELASTAPQPPPRRAGQVGLTAENQADLQELETPPEGMAPPPNAPSLSSAPKPPPPSRAPKPALPTAKPRKKPWWEDIFGDDFSRAYKPLSGAQVGREAEFIEKVLEIPRGAVLLDLCCGQGQLAIELNRRGFPVVGYDLSVFQLAMASDNAQVARQKINFLQGDMREMAFDSMFDAVLSWDTSFGYFEEEKNLDVIRRCFLALKPGGSLLLDVMNRDYAASEAPTNQWYEGDGCICMDDMSFDWITSRLKVKRSVILDDGRSKEIQYSIRLYNLSELGKLLHDVGFRVLSVSGHLAMPGVFMGPRSPRMAIRAQKPIA